MKIGILTFHWATNYGAILQAWCLQEYLSNKGHEVEIINYKPANYDSSWLKFFLHPKTWKNINRYLACKKKESLLAVFRDRILNMTRRYRFIRDLGCELEKYDALISGSDQVLNPWFTKGGDNGNPSAVYWLGVGRKDIKRIGYAVSFGCEQYPEDVSAIARKWVNGFDAIGTRENTGQHILDQLGFMGPKFVTPDPTLLIGKELFSLLGVDIQNKRSNYTCVYMLRHEIKLDCETRYIDDTQKPLSMEKWLETIVNANGLVTNSYHGTLMAVFAHVPFAILLESGSGSGMNDRFYTLLQKLGCENRVAWSVDEAKILLKKDIDFAKLDEAVVKYRKDGEMFLSLFF